jgi:hypothetical protein
VGSTLNVTPPIYHADVFPRTGSAYATAGLAHHSRRVDRDASYLTGVDGNGARVAEAAPCLGDTTPPVAVAHETVVRTPGLRSKDLCPLQALGPDFSRGLADSLRLLAGESQPLSSGLTEPSAVLFRGSPSHKRRSGALDRGRMPAAAKVGRSALLCPKLGPVVAE